MKSVSTGQAVLEVCVLVSLFVWNAVATYAILRFDIARLDDEQRARSWPESTMRVASFWFGPLAALVHFVRTRRSLGGVALGLLAAAGVVAVSTLIGAVAESAGLLRGAP